MTWTAIVPLRSGEAGKTRLSPSLSPGERVALSERMLGHVLDCLSASASVRRIVVLSPLPVGRGLWREDRGGGLNVELAAAQADLGACPIMVVHADLPMLSPDDVDAMTDAARGGWSLAPDRHGEGSNALAVMPEWRGTFAFGQGSFARHCCFGDACAALVRRPGLMLDIDTPDDLDEALRLGWKLH